MPRGIPNKKKEEVKTETATNQFISPEPVKAEEVKVSEQVKQAPKLEPLAAGQAYFESPDGVVIIGDSTKDQVWYRQGNGGRGMFINKKR